MQLPDWAGLCMEVVPAFSVASHEMAKEPVTVHRSEWELFWWPANRKPWTGSSRTF